MDANWSLFKKGLLLVAIPLLAQLLFLAFLLQTRISQADAQRWANHSKDVIAQTEAAYRASIESHSNTRAYVLTGDRAFLEARGQVVKSLPQHIEELRELVRDKPEQQAKVREAAERIEQLTAWQNEAIQMVRTGNRAGATARMRALGGKQRLDAVHAALDDFLKEEERLNDERQATLERSGATQTGALIGGGILALLSTAALLWLFSRGIGRRFAVLADNARRLAAGKELAPPLQGRDEISRLDRVFHDMANALAQRDRENEMFVYSVSHDLRSPLVNLQGFSQELAAVNGDLRGLLTDNEVPDTVRKRGLTLIDRDASEAVHFIQTAVRRLAGIIDSLLRLSRVGRVQYQWQEVDVQSAVVRVVEALRVTLAERGAEVVLKELPPCWGDPTAVELVFANLIGNAINYLDPGRRGKIEVGGALEEDGARRYYIQDNGQGISAEHLPKVFVAFQRLHPSAAPGEGIGLALVRRILERHGGRIWVESTVGQGSTFFVVLPAHAPGGVESGEVRSPAAIPQQQPKR